MPDGYGYTDPKTNQRVSALRDMFDGGGMGRSGNQFQGGGAISALGNALKVRPLGSTAPREDIGFRGRMGSREYFRDMFDGGGAGASSAAGFADGPYSGLANNLMTLGLLRPIGAQRADRMAPMRPNVDMPLSDFGSQSIVRQPVQSATDLYGSDVTVGGSGAGDVSDVGFYSIQQPPTVTSSRIPTTYNLSARLSEPLSSPQYARDMTPLGTANVFGGVAAKNPNYDPAMIMRALGLYHGRSGF